MHRSIRAIECDQAENKFPIYAAEIVEHFNHLLSSKRSQNGEIDWTSDFYVAIFVSDFSQHAFALRRLQQVCGR